MKYKRTITLDIKFQFTKRTQNYDRAPFAKIVNYFTQPAITCSKLTIELLEQGVKYVQS